MECSQGNPSNYYVSQVSLVYKRILPLSEPPIVCLSQSAYDILKAWDDNVIDYIELIMGFQNQTKTHSIFTTEISGERSKYRTLG